MGLRFALGFGCSPNHASRANRHFLFFAAPKNESRQLMERRHLANQKTLLNRSLERAVALPFWISGCLLFAIHRIEYAALPCARLKIFALRGSLKSGRKRLMRRRGAGACSYSWQAAKRLLGQMIRMFKSSLRSAIAKLKPNLFGKKPFGGTPNGFVFQAAYKPNSKGWSKRRVERSCPCGGAWMIGQPETVCKRWLKPAAAVAIHLQSRGVSSRWRRRASSGRWRFLGCSVRR